jgi:branched-chain amino acid transport system substrate-binding protein
MHRRLALQTIAALAAPSVLTHARAASRVRVGVSLPISSVQSGVAADLQAGLLLAFMRARDRGMEVVAEWEDDRSDPDRTAKAIEQFGKDSSFVATTSIVGTPHAIKALPAAVRTGLPVVGLRSGAAELRDGRAGVYHLRASYNDELSRIAAQAAGAALERVAVVYSDDAFGRASMEHVRSIAPSLKLEITSTVAAERNGSNVQQMVAAAVNGPGRQPKGLLMLLIAEPMEKAVRHAREALNYPYPIWAMSFCATRALAESKAPYLKGLGLMSAFPLPRIDVQPLSQDFMRLGAAHKPGIELSLTAYEAFVYGSTLATAVAAAKEPTREALRQALRAPLSVGGYRIAFDASNVGFHYLQTLRKSDDGVLRA